MSTDASLTLIEREREIVLRSKAYSGRDIARQLNRNKSTISRELHRIRTADYTVVNCAQDVRKSASGAPSEEETTVLPQFTEAYRLAEIIAHELSPPDFRRNIIRLIHMKGIKRDDCTRMRKRKVLEND